MARRIRPLKKPVPIEHDGEAVLAEKNEPLAVALIAADRLALARSPKLHRPRGPFCLRAACDGCLARVNGVPNVMTCTVRARGGERIETQNVLGSRELDLLRAADFLFPHGIDHHRLFAGVTGVSGVLQSFARGVAGLGRLPDRAVPAKPAQRAKIAALVVGGGTAGLSAAARLGGPETWLVDDGLELGGALGVLAPRRARKLVSAAEARNVRIERRATVIGLYRGNSEREVLRAVVVGPRSTHLLECERVLVASGSHAQTYAFPNNDLPGVWSGRAALMLLGRGVLPGERVVIAGNGRFADELERALARITDGSTSKPVQVRRVAADALTSAHGRSRVMSVTLRDGDRERRVNCDALVLDGPGAASVELVRQAGGHVQFRPDVGFVPVLDDFGRSSPGVYVLGSARGSAHDSAANAVRVADAILAGES